MNGELEAHLENHDSLTHEGLSLTTIFGQYWVRNPADAIH